MDSSKAKTDNVPRCDSKPNDDDSDVDSDDGYSKYDPFNPPHMVTTYVLRMITDLQHPWSMTDLAKLVVTVTVLVTGSIIL